MRDREHVGRERHTHTAPEVGVLAWDSRRRLVGVLMDAQCGRMYLRPPEGGVEWEALPGDVQAVGHGEVTARTAAEYLTSGKGIM